MPSPMTAEKVTAFKPPVAVETPMSGVGGALAIMPRNFGEVESFAERMAKSRFVPGHLRDKPNDCLAVCLQALRWAMDPFAVAQKTYFTKDGAPPAYEAQLVNAVVYARAPLAGRLKIEWLGQWPARRCKVTGHIIGDDDPKVREVLASNIKVRNSPLWVTDPDQQLAYYTTRAWARLYCPDVLMGVYTPDDEDSRAQTARDITPAAEPPERQAPASRLDAMEAVIAGETEPALETAPPPSLAIPVPIDDAGESDWATWGNQASAEIGDMMSVEVLDLWCEANEAPLGELAKARKAWAERINGLVQKKRTTLTGA